MVINRHSDACSYCIINRHRFPHLVSVTLLRIFAVIFVTQNKQYISFICTNLMMMLNSCNMVQTLNGFFTDTLIIVMSSYGLSVFG